MNSKNYNITYSFALFRPKEKTLTVTPLEKMVSITLVSMSVLMNVSPKSVFGLTTLNNLIFPFHLLSNFSGCSIKQFNDFK